MQNSGTLPIICESITHVSIGGVSARPKDLKGLDSYQEEDLERLREKWTEALNKRRDYLDEQLQIIMNKEGNIHSTAYWACVALVAIFGSTILVPCL